MVVSFKRFLYHRLKVQKVLTESLASGTLELALGNVLDNGWTAPNTGEAVPPEVMEARSRAQRVLEESLASGRLAAIESLGEC